MLSGPSGAMYPHGSFVDRQSRELPDVVVSRADSRASRVAAGAEYKALRAQGGKGGKSCAFRHPRVLPSSSFLTRQVGPLSRLGLAPHTKGSCPPHRSQHPNHSRLPKPENMSSSTSAPVQQCVPYPTFGATTHACGPGLTARSRHAVDTCATATLALRACLIR